MPGKGIKSIKGSAYEWLEIGEHVTVASAAARLWKSKARECWTTSVYAIKGAPVDTPSGRG
jgi:hypothetical protein